MRTRHREVENTLVPGYKTVTRNQFGESRTKTIELPGLTTMFPYVRREKTEDEVHPNYPHSGGPFSSVKVTTTHQLGYGRYGLDYFDNYYTNSQVYRIHEGDVFVVPYASTEVMPEATVQAALDQGPTAWNRFKPAQPDVSISVFVAELRDLPGLIFKKLDSFRSLGNNYLAYQFGWRPFLSDLRKWYKSIVDVDARIAQLKRDNGQYIKRGGTLFSNVDQSEDSFDATTNYIYGVPFKDGTITDRITTSERCWFSARFKYYIPGLNSSFGTARAIQELWDLKITPEQVYQLIPFSWLLDWFTNVGDLISNLMSHCDDNLTAKYAYVMFERERKIKRSARIRHEVITGTSTYPDFIRQSNYSTPSCTQVISSKARCSASPFGFNCSFGDLTGYQTSILAALGISRLRF
jgi:hypothetical protein